MTNQEINKRAQENKELYNYYTNIASFLNSIENGVNNARPFFSNIEEFYNDLIIRVYRINSQSLKSFEMCYPYTKEGVERFEAFVIGIQCASLASKLSYLEKK